MRRLYGMICNSVQLQIRKTQTVLLLIPDRRPVSLLSSRRHLPLRFLCFMRASHLRQGRLSKRRRSIAIDKGTEASETMLSLHLNSRAVLLTTRGDANWRRALGVRTGRVDTRVCRPPKGRWHALSSLLQLVLSDVTSIGLKAFVFLDLSLHFVTSVLVGTSSVVIPNSTAIIT